MVVCLLLSLENRQNGAPPREKQRKQKRHPHSHADLDAWLLSKSWEDSPSTCRWHPEGMNVLGKPESCSVGFSRVQYFIEPSLGFMSKPLFFKVSSLRFFLPGVSEPGSRLKKFYAQYLMFKRISFCEARWGYHYSKTLAAWLKNWEASKETIVKARLLRSPAQRIGGRAPKSSKGRLILLWGCTSCDGLKRNPNRKT